MKDTGASDEVARIRDGGETVLAQLFTAYRPRLARMIEFRLDRRLVRRIDPDDVLQEAYIDATRRLPDYLAAPQVSLYVWLRQLTWQTLLMMHRKHLSRKRHPGQEVSVSDDGAGDGTTYSLADAVLGSLTSPSQAVMREEQAAKLRSAFNSMEDLDREVLALRHFEQLSNQEVAEVLGLSKTAASNRYIRALSRLRDVLVNTLGPEFAP